MNYKFIILEHFVSYDQLKKAMYLILFIAKMFDAKNESTHGESFIVWLLMAILLSNSIT